MDYIQVKNLRSLYDTGEIEMKKINMLVGNNSSGKSTFLRIFPLLKQSFNKRINGPILWAGDEDDYVDFGSYQEALSNGCSEDTIRFKFSFEGIAQIRSMLPSNMGKVFVTTNEERAVTIELAVGHSRQTTYDYISELRLEYGDDRIAIEYSDKYEILSLIVNGEKTPVIKDDTDSSDYSSGNEIFEIPLFSVKATARKNFHLCGWNIV